MSSSGFKRRQNPRVKYALITIVSLYLFWLLGLPLLTLLKEIIGQGWTKIYQQLFSADVLHAFLITLVLCISSVVINTIFGTMLALVLVRQNFKGKSFINALLDLPFAVSAVVVGYMFILLLGKDGWLGGFASWTGIRWIFSLPGMILATLFVTFPFMVRELIPVLQEVGRDQEDAAHILGANSWVTFWKITLPSIKWGLFYGMSLTFARALGEFGAVLVVGAGIMGETATATIYIFRALEERMYAGGYSAAIILILLAFLLLLSMEILKKRRAK